MKRKESPIKETGKFHAFYTMTCMRDGKLMWEDKFDNTVVDEGLNYLLNATFNQTAQIATMYCGLFSGNYTPLGTDTGANISTNSTEFTDYSQTTRVAHVNVASTAQSITNNASRAVFDITAVAATDVYGAFLISDSTKGGAIGTLFSAARVPGGTPRSVISGDQILLEYTVNATSA